jgi:hypothetical protein
MITSWYNPLIALQGLLADSIYFKFHHADTGLRISMCYLERRGKKMPGLKSKV